MTNIKKRIFITLFDRYVHEAIALTEKITYI